MPDGRGGYQRPSNPAAFSGPGSLSQRTDTGPSRAPGRISGKPYGEGQEANSLLQAARGATGGAGPGAPSTSREAGGAPQGAVQLPDVFGPTDRPGEPATAGAFGSETILPRDPAAVIRAAYQAHPTPELERLLERSPRA